MKKVIAIAGAVLSASACQVVSEGPSDEFHCTVSADCPAAQSCCADDFCRPVCACGNAGVSCRTSADCCSGFFCGSGRCGPIDTGSGSSTGASTTGAQAAGTSTAGGTGPGSSTSGGSTSSTGGGISGSTAGGASGSAAGSSSSGTTGGATGCAGQGASCTPADPCDLGQTDCGGNCVDTFQPNPSMNGQACSGGTACWDGACLNCGDACALPVGSPCDDGTLSCAGASPTCQDTGAVSFAANGEPCGPAAVCYDGACQACNQGATCPSAFPCGAAAIDCSQGLPNCVEVGPDPAAEGLSCGGVGEICLDGGCACPPGETLCGAVCTAGSCNQSCGPDLFGRQVVYQDDQLGYGEDIGSVGLGDFNGDGFLDVAASYGSGVAILPGTGTGGFGAFTAAGTDGGFDLGDLVVADFNGDRISDIAVTNGYPDSGVGILLGTGTGGFAPWTNFLVPAGAGHLAAGDVNGDGRTDLVTSGSGGVSVLLGNGGGSFASQGPFPAGANPSAIALGDVNRDGKLDAVVAECSFTSDVHLLGVLPGDGQGNFGTVTEYSAGPNVYDCATGVALGDFNGDGWVDAAVITFGSSNVYVFLANGSGGFSPTAVSYPLAVAPGLSFIVTGDFDGDGNLDLAVAQNDDTSYSSVPPLTDDSVSVLLGTGKGTFAVQPPLIVGSSPVSIAVGALKSGGRQDLVVANMGYATATLGNTLSVLLNQCP